MMVGSDVAEVRAAHGRMPRAPCACACSDLSLPPADAHGVALERHLAAMCAAAKSSASPAWPATARTSCSRRCPASGLAADARRRAASTARRCGRRSASTRAAGSAPPSCRRSASATRPRRASACPTTSLLSGHATERHGPARLHRLGRGAGRGRSAIIEGLRRAQGPSAIPHAGTLSGGNLQKFVVGREILREPGVLVVNQPTWGVDAGAAADDPAGADRPRRARRGGARDQPGPRRDCSRSRTGSP